MKTLHTIYTSFAKRALALIISVMAVTVAWGADKLAYNIVFSNSANNNSTISESTKASTVIAEDSRTYVTASPFSNISKAYYGDTQTSIRLGTSSAQGELTIALSSEGEVAATKIVVSCGYWKSGESPTLSINGAPAQTISSSEQNLIFDIDDDITSLVLNTTKRAYVYSISVYTEAAPSTFTVTCQSNNSSYGTVSQASVTNVANNTSISAEGNVLTIGETEITATPNAQDANYTYAFSEWTGIPTGGKVTENITVTANFTRTERALTNYRTTCTEPSTFTVTYNANDATSGSVPEDNTEYEKDAQVTVLGNTGNLAKTGYTFSGWNTEDNGKGTTYAAGDKFTITENTTLYAKWTANTYTITLNTNDGTINSGAISSYTYGVGATLPTDVTKTGYTFAGWYNNSDFTGDPIKTIGTTETDNKEFWAKWTPAVYTITYKDQGNAAFSGTHEEGSPTTHTYNTETTLKSASKEHYTFGGWYKESNCSGTKVTTLGATEYTDNITLYAQWTAKTYTITLDANGGTFVDKRDSQTKGSATFDYIYGTYATYSDAPNLTEYYTDLKRDGYQFDGWVSAGSPWNKLFTSTGDRTIQAQWSKLYTITLSENGTTTEPTTQTSTTYKLPAKLTAGSCLDDTKDLVGWSKVAIPTPGDKPTSDYYELGATAPLTTDQTTFYAVFATPGEGGDDIPLISFLGGVKSELLAIDGISALGLGDDYAENNAPYRVKLDNTGDYILYTNSSGSKITQLYIKVKMIGGGNTSKITVQTSDNNSDYADIDEWSIEGDQGNVKAVLLTVNSSSKYIRLYFDKGSNVGLGNLIFYTSSTSYSDYTTTCVKLPDPVLSFETEPANPVVFTDAVCGGNSSKQSVTVVGENLRDVVNVSVTGPYKIARTSSTALKDFTTSLTLDKTAAGAIHSNYQTVYIISTPPAQSTVATTGTLTFTTTNGNTLTVNLSTPTITCTPRTLTFNDRGIKTTQEYYAGTEVPEPATPTGVCGEYEFDGWALAKIESGSTTYAKVEFPYIMPANNQTVLYAVYRYTEGPTNQYELVTEIESGKDYVIAAYDEPNGDFALTNSESSTNGKFTSVKVECDVNNIITTDNADIIWTVTGNDEDGYKFYNSAVKKYIEMYRSDGKSLLRLVDNCTNTFDVNIEMDENDKVYVDITSPEVDENYNVFSFYQELFNVYTRCDYNIYFYEQTATPFYTTTPDCHPSVTLISDGEVYVTATNGRGIMAATPLTLTTTDLAPNTEIAISSNSNDIYFSTERNTNFAMAQASQPQTSLTLPTNEGGELETQLYIHYKPSADGDGTPAEVVVTADVSTHNPPFTAQKTIHVRNLPAKFVIATKAGATWYALPANMNGATNPAAVVIEVDETTMTATAPNTTPYTLWPVATINGGTDRYKKYGERLRFAAVNNGNRGLWANDAKSGTTINNDAAIIAANSTAGAAYEWKITTTIVDGNWQYTLQTDQDKNQQYLRYWVGATGAPKWGTYAAGNNQLYFLPVTETEPFDYKVVEWYPTKMLIQTDATIANPTAEIGDAPINNVTCTNKGSKLYEIAGLPLESNPTKVLTIKFSDGGNNYTNATAIPVIISQSATTVSSAPFTTLTKDVYNYADLVVRDGATLTIDGGTHAENTFFNVTIYPTSKISVPDGKKLTVHSLTFFGGIDEIYNGSTYDLYKYGVPELSLKGSLKKSISTIDYLMRVNLDQMYSLSVPYDVQLADIKYWDGSDIALGSALYVSAYDGEARANQSKKTWIYETDFESRLGAATLKAGVGYTISAEPQVENDDYSILRMPMNSNIANDATEVAKTVAVTAWGIDANITDNHKGWNLVGNPYMTTIQGADDADLVLGYLKETGTGPWEWVDDGIRYVTIPSDDGTYYWQQKFTTAELLPFKNFFVQVGTSGDLVFGLSTRQSMPARSTQAAIEKEVEFEILMSNDARQDNTGLLISEEYSPAYEINADLEKMIGSMSVYTIYGGYKLAYNALSPINASEWIPVGYIAPAAGEYTFRLDDVEKIVEQVEHVYVIDYDANNIVDLMTDEYKFTTDKEQNDNRFAINVVLSQDKDNTTTGLDIIQGNNTAPIKFIHQDKMYIYNDGIIYDATGKQVTNINK